MEFFLLLLISATLTLGLALFSNWIRSRQTMAFELEPNCLLTRYPLLFITGPRSIFYFKNYWNQFPSFLAEHGYEVFTLRLPWRDSHKRLNSLLESLKAQEKAHQKHHLILDKITFFEFQNLTKLNSFPSVKTLTVLVPEGDQRPHQLTPLPIPTEFLEVHPSNQGLGFVLRLSFLFHRWLLNNSTVITLGVLGGITKKCHTNSTLLLKRAKTLAEMDLQNSQT